MLKKLMVTATFCLFGASAQAQSVDWSGNYWGFFIGGVKADSMWDDGSLLTPEFDVDGAIGGVLIGRNWQSGNTVYGIEADIAGSGVSGEYLPQPCGDSCFVDMKSMATIRGRVGIARGKGHYYLTLGAAIGKFDYELRPGGTDSDTRTAAIGGIGGEWALNNGWTGRAEYLMTDFGTEVQTFGEVPLNVAVDSVHILRFGLTKKF